MSNEHGLTGSGLRHFHENLRLIVHGYRLGSISDQGYFSITRGGERVIYVTPTIIFYDKETAYLKRTIREALLKVPLGG